MAARSEPIKILIVDDAVVVRRMLANLLAEDADLLVVGTAVNGRDALQRMPDLKPDLVILDIDMPEMNGLDTLAVLSRDYPRVAVVMFSTSTRRGAAETLEALALGAKDYVAKPEHATNAGEALQQVRSVLVPKIKALCPERSKEPLSPLVRTPRPTSASGGASQHGDSAPANVSVTLPSRTPAAVPVVPPPAVRQSAARRAGIDLVVIGSSTGGPNALAVVFASLPADLAVPVVIVQHMPPVFTRMLAERLDGLSPLKVREGTDGARLAAGEAWIAPGDFHMTVKRTGDGVVIGLNQQAAENSCRPAVDVLLRSAVETFGARVLAVILTGMGQDGLLAAMRLHELGGQVVAQDEASSVVWGMPGNVVRAGIADVVLPIDRIAAEISTRVRAAASGLKETGSWRISDVGKRPC
ncbi:protein-glutamate methylesterase/protein-glutamine glutaminase [Plasticicumulans acidivorans]|uniref:Protein-glutamate methylesterase/protein-glutamine glutaminase n=1 Tax=Plasticicumulans acidivorans TaxID=886464 RepID=A0A317N1T7_9GAMM|nr:chemotaxis response regulator protein-glutamate methylesterase [Plasticicumulans acidivorans]PWV63253.1 response regulator receiver-modulated CheB methylesterase [Plasticicumulans acidivorans]